MAPRMLVLVIAAVLGATPGEFGGPAAPVVGPGPAYGVAYAGFVGGDVAKATAVDALGAQYVVGTTISPHFPVTPKKFGTGSAQFADGFVAKVKRDSTGLEWVVLIGAANPTGIALDSAGNIYVAGWTEAPAGVFPVLVGPSLAIHGQPQGTPPSQPPDAFVTKIDPTGANLIYSGYIGGSGTDGYQEVAIAVDTSGAAYVASTTRSDDFPVSGGWPYRSRSPALGPADDTGFIAKVAPSGASLVYSGYLAGDLASPRSVAVTSAGEAVVAGSGRVPVVNGFSRVSTGATAFVAKVNAGGTGFVWSDIYGSDVGTDAQGVALDGSGNSYITGTSQTASIAMPTAVGPSLAEHGLGDAYVMKLDPSGAIVYSGFLGGTCEDHGLAVAVDVAGRAHVLGTTVQRGATCPITGGPSAPSGAVGVYWVALVAANGASIDQVVDVPGVTGNGQPGEETLRALGLDRVAAIYLAGGTIAPSAFPTVVGPVLTSSAPVEAVVMKLGILLQPDVPAAQVSLPNVTKTLGGRNGWVTPFIIQNTGTTSTTLVINFYRFSDGSLVASRQVASLLPGRSYADVPNSDPDLPDDTQFSVVVSSFNAPIVGVVNEQQGSTASSIATFQSAAYDGFNAGATTVYVANVTRRFFGYDVPLIIQDLGGLAATGRAHFVSFDGTQVVDIPLAIQPGRSQVIDPNFTAELRDGTQYAVTVTSDQPVAVVANANNDVVGPMSYSYDGIATGATTIYAPLVTKGQGPFLGDSPIIVQNVGSSAASATLTFFPIGGGPTQRFVLENVAAGGSAVFDPRFDLGTTTPCAGPSATCLGSGRYSLRIDSAAPVAAIVNPGSTTAAGAYAAIQRPGAKFFLPNVTKALGGPSGFTTPILLQSATATDATLQWFRFDNGALLLTQRVSLSPNISVEIDPSDPALPSDTQFAVVVSSTTGTVAAIVEELSFGAGDGLMIYEGFPGP